MDFNKVILRFSNLAEFVRYMYLTTPDINHDAEIYVDDDPDGNITFSYSDPADLNLATNMGQSSELGILFMLLGSFGAAYDFNPIYDDDEKFISMDISVRKTPLPSVLQRFQK
ncbi:hypothetical protein [Nicoliella lavandulae]|uniref:Uncharacterized protein n=1 Tax=Nicoliella lavandulae TaxID=3082954 RepID=A0ABU8SNX4_9LACO